MNAARTMRAGRLAAFLAAGFGAAPAAADAVVHLKCESGPVAKSYGGTKWTVFGCDDGKSLAFVADKASPAAPFTFMLIYANKDYDLSGRGTGARKATDAAYADLQKLSAADVLALLNATKAAKPKN